LEKSTYGTAQFKVKYRTLELQVAPGATASSLGTLKKGAVVTVIADEGRYYYKVRLGNGLEGYVYKPAGELIGSFTPAPAESSNGKKEVQETKKLKDTSSKNGTPPPLALEKTRTVSKSRTTTTRNGASAFPSTPPTSSSVSGVTSASSGSGVKLPSADAKDVTITSAEIAVFDKPGLIGKQVAKLKRGDQVTVLGQDGFFFEILLPSGIVGYIPRYAGQLS
jgi:uncharacterized protein YgiM (DUF1202 family)